MKFLTIHCQRCERIAQVHNPNEILCRYCRDKARLTEKRRQDTRERRAAELARQAGAPLDPRWPTCTGCGCYVSRQNRTRLCQRCNARQLLTHWTPEHNAKVVATKRELPPDTIYCQRCGAATEAKWSRRKFCSGYCRTTYNRAQAIARHFKEALS